MQAAIGSVRCPLLIGRDAFLELAERRLAEVVAGRGHMLLVGGEAGIGKTRYLEAVDQRARERGFLSAWGAVAPQDLEVPGASILDLARTMTRVPGLDEAGREMLALADEPAAAQQTRRRHVVSGVVDRIVGTVTRPILLGFEDLQWTDELSLEVIAELVRRSRDLPLMIAAGYRTDEAPIGTELRDWRSRMLTQRLAEEIKLRPLDEEETALATTLVLDTGLPAPRDVAAAVYERTDGIPLHIEELLGALSADARANGYAIRQATVPDTIEDAVIARLAHRSPEAQAVARAGAVMGRCFVPDVLAGIMDLPVDAIDDPLQELIDHAILWPPGDRGLYDFRHQLLRDAIYRSVPPSDRRRFHARAAEFGTQLEGHSEVHSSVHFERAGLRRQAYEAAVSGAREAARLSAHREAFELYRRAVANMPEDLDRLEAGTIFEAAADEAGAIEEHEICLELTERAGAAYRAAGEPAKAIWAELTVHAILRRDLRPISVRLEAIDRASAEVDGLDDPEAATMLRAELAWMRSKALFDERSIGDARDVLADYRRLAKAGGDDEADDVYDWQAGIIDVGDGKVDEGLARISAIAMAAERAGRESTGVSAYRDAAQMAMFAMDYPTAMRMIGAGVRYADSIEQSHCAHVMAATSAMVAWANGDWALAEQQAGQSMVDRGCRRGAEIARWSLGYAAMGQGRTSEAAKELDDSLSVGLVSESPEMILPPLWGLAEVALLDGDAGLAIARCTEAFEMASAVGERLLFVPFVVTGARAHLGAGRPAEAAGWVEACAAFLAPVERVATPGLDHGRGLVALAEGTTGIARTHLEAAIDGWDAKGRIWEATWARLDLATCLVRSSRFADAVTLAVEAKAVATRVSSRPLADRADAVLRMARGRVAIDEPWRPLTAREFEVARLIGEGRTNIEIADELGIAPKTASSHVEHILAKLGASRRAEIATWASNVDRSVASH